MRGRRAKPAGLKRVQGNPGRRPLPPEPKAAAKAKVSDQAKTIAKPDAPRERKSKTKNLVPSSSMSFVSITAMAKQAYDLIGGELKALNFVRPSDESLLLRYADMFAQYWAASEYVAKHGSTYDCPMTNGGFMRRTRPEFGQLMMAAKRMEVMEDRLGLSPAARQTYLQRVMAAGQQAILPGMNADDQGDGTKPDLPPVAPPEHRPPTGFVRRDALN